MSERITISVISDALSYAAIAQQVEITDATVAVYFDQLHRCEASEVVRAVKRWVSTYDEPYRRLPTVGELRAIMREGKAQIDPKVSHELKIAVMVKDARARGQSEEQIQTLIDNGSTSLPPPRRKV
jgi:peptidyl-tRNA hydrolase